MVSLFNPKNTNYATNGDYILHPDTCNVTERAGGEYEITLTHPMDDAVWQGIREDCVVKAPVPMPTFSKINSDGETTTVTIGTATTATQLLGIPGETDLDRPVIYEDVAVGDKFVIFDDSDLIEPENYDTAHSPSLQAAIIYRAYEYFHNFNERTKHYYRVQSMQTGQTGYILRTCIPANQQVRYSYNLAEYGDVSNLLYTFGENNTAYTAGYRQCRDQLFRLYEVTVDPIKHRVSARGRHIFYDCVGMLVGNYSPENTPVDVALATAKAIVMNDVNSYNRNRRMLCSFSNMSSVLITEDFSFRSLIEVLLDPDIGIVPKVKAKIIRDNMDTFIVENTPINRGFEISYGRNMLGVEWTTSTDNVITSIFPTGTDSEGNLIFLEDQIVVDSPVLTDYAYVRMKRLEVPDVKERDPEGTYRQKLIDAANAEFAKGVHLKNVTLKVTFARLGDSVEYQQYRNLERLYLYDTVIITHSPVGFNTTGQVREYIWDCLRLRYDSIEIGDIFEVKGETLAGYQLSDSSISGGKLLPGSITGSNIANGSIPGGKIAALSIGSAQIQNASIDVGKIANFESEVADIATANIQDANIERLKAQVADIVQAKIAQAEIDSATVENLTAGAADIVTAIVNNAEIDIASIAQLQSDEITALQAYVDDLTASIATAEEVNAKVIAANTAWLATATIQSAQIGDLAAKVAVIENGKITNATIDTAKVNNLNATIAELSQAEIGAASIDWAQLKTMVGDHAIIAEMVNDKMYIADLAVTDANMAHLTVGELVVKGQDGKFYSVTVNGDGQITSSEKQVEYANIGADAIDSTKIIENSINADRLNVNQIFAKDAIVMNQIVANMNVDQLFARDGWMTKLTTSLIQSNFREMLNLESDTGLILRVRDAAKQAADETAELRLVITSTNDVMSNTAAASILTAHVYKGNTDVTADYDASCFHWKRISGNSSEDATWAAEAGHSGVKQITLSPADVAYSATITCDLIVDEPRTNNVLSDNSDESPILDEMRLG